MSNYNSSTSKNNMVQYYLLNEYYWPHWSLSSMVLPFLQLKWSEILGCHPLQTCLRMQQHLYGMCLVPAPFHPWYCSFHYPLYLSLQHHHLRPDKILPRRQFSNHRCSLLTKNVLIALRWIYSLETKLLLVRN